MEERNEKGQFLPGHPGGPGRPKGARNRLSEAFLQVSADDFEQNGMEAIDRLRREHPGQYANVIAKLMPKLMELSGPDGDKVPHSLTIEFVD